MKKFLIIIFTALMMISTLTAQQPCEKLSMAADGITRYSVIEVYPEFIDEYLPLALEVGDVSMRTESGVLVMYPTVAK